MKANHPLYREVARIGQAIASPARLGLLDLLRQGPRTVDALAKEAGLTLANASQHLKVLREARLVEAEKRGVFVTYRLADDGVEGFYRSLRGLAEARLAEVQQIARAFADKRGAFCMNSGFRNALAGDWTKLKALALAVAVQLLVLPLVFWLGLAQPALLPLKPWAALAGGLLFGLSMRWAGACAAGVWYKLGAG